VAAQTRQSAAATFAALTEPSFDLRSPSSSISRLLCMKNEKRAERVDIRSFLRR